MTTKTKPDAETAVEKHKTAGELAEAMDNAESIANAAKRKMSPERAVDVLALARDGIRTTDKAYKDATKDIAEKLKPFDQAKRIAKANLTGAEEAALTVLREELAEGNPLPDVTKAGTRLTLQRKLSLAYNDAYAGDIPEDLLKPMAERIDWGKVQARIDAGETPPFVTVARSTTFVTKLAEAIE